MLKVLYFASLRELLELNEEQVGHQTGETVATLIQRLCAEHDSRWEILRNDCTNVAVNQQMARLDTQLAEGDEIAFFPPVTGG